MRRFVRVVSVVSAVCLAAGMLAAPALARREREVGPRSRVATRAIVHGRDAGRSRDYATSFEVFARRGRDAVESSSAAARVPAPRAPQATLGFDALSDPLSFPADTTGALGDTYFVTAVNTQVAVYDRSGNVVVAPIQLDALHPDSVGRFAFDPKVVYDQYNDTFVVVYLIQEDSPALSRIIVVAIPNATANTTSTWCATSFAGDGLPGSPNVWADYPGLGYNHDRVTVTTNQFTFPTTTAQFRYAQVMSIPKTALYDCTMPPPVPTVFGGTATQDSNGFPAFTLQPAQTVDGNAAQLLVSFQCFPVKCFNTGTGKDSYVTIWRVKSTSSGLKLKKGAVGVGRYTLPLLGTQGGGTDADTFWDAGDERLINAYFDVDANELFAAHATAKDFQPDPISGGYLEDAVRWYELNPAGKLKNSVRARKGNVGAPEVDAGWPTVATDGSGNLFVTYNRASAVTGEFLSAWVAEIPPSGTTATQLLLKSGLATYDVIAGPERWGDFTGINRDPANPAVVATFNQYALDADSWQQFVSLVQHV